MSQKDPDLDAAYELSTPEDSRKLYADWADSYDRSFADQNDYILPFETARAFTDAGGTGPVLDVGAGTGLCGAVLAGLGVGPIDATDISAEMLEQALRKDIYRDAIEADLTKGLPIPPDSYAGIISSGTFTTGHVGPDEIDPLLRIAQPGALFALSINARHYESAGFATKFAALEPVITDLTLKDVPIYGPRATGAHRADRAFVALFHKR
ncbi:class I SAM-dependent DNA methyltransferase [Aestuariivita boseongensis]|uniref:class I SAM-dependent DNA methyltransferase n=1 Tax=Aestuariivita boseongensis TaxID=1470562 RepID=UPI000682B819|nr:class I SAM-dependent methyltransferase [Aestuariivita boseongensis]